MWWHYWQTCDREVVCSIPGWLPPCTIMLDKLLTPTCLDHQAAQFGTGLRAMTPEGGKVTAGLLESDGGLPLML